MSQNSLRLSWTREEVDNRLHGIMKAIHKQCVDAAGAYGMAGNYVAGANIAGFLKVADSMLDQASSDLVCSICERSRDRSNQEYAREAAQV